MATLILVSVLTKYRIGYLVGKYIMTFYSGKKALYDVILGVKQSECYLNGPCNVGSRYSVHLLIRCAYYTQW